MPEKLRSDHKEEHRSRNRLRRVLPWVLSAVGMFNAAGDGAKEHRINAIAQTKHYEIEAQESTFKSVESMLITAARSARAGVREFQWGHRKVRINDPRFVLAYQKLKQRALGSTEHHVRLMSKKVDAYCERKGLWPEDLFTKTIFEEMTRDEPYIAEMMASYVDALQSAMGKDIEDDLDPVLIVLDTCSLEDRVHPGQSGVKRAMTPELRTALSSAGIDIVD